MEIISYPRLTSSPISPDNTAATSTIAVEGLPSPHLTEPSQSPKNSGNVGNGAVSNSAVINVVPVPTSTNLGSTNDNSSRTILSAMLRSLSASTSPNANFSISKSSKELNITEYSNKELKAMKKRCRTVMTPNQSRVLRKVLEQTAFPSTEIRENLAKLLGMKPRTVQIWFQNQRQKSRQGRPNSGSSSDDLQLDNANSSCSEDDETSVCSSSSPFESSSTSVTSNASSPGFTALTAAAFALSHSPIDGHQHPQQHQQSQQRYTTFHGAVYKSVPGCLPAILPTANYYRGNTAAAMNAKRIAQAQLLNNVQNPNLTNRPPPIIENSMDNYLGLRLRLIFKDGSSAEGTVNSINDSAQKLSLSDVKLLQKGSKQAVSFPELTVLAGNIDDVEIITNESVNNKAPKPPKAKATKPNNSNNSNNSSPNSFTTSTASTNSYNPNSPYATPSVYASKAHTFPAGNARHTLPHEEFDFAANLARFDKATEFKKIQSEDLVPKDERLVAINSPQRKLGIHENVLESGVVKIAKKPKPASSDPVSPAVLNQIASVNSGSSGLRQSTSTSPIPISVADEIMEKFKHLAVPSGTKNATSKVVFVEEGSSSSESEPEPEQSPRSIPMMNSQEFDTIFQEKADYFRTISALNFSHHLLAELDAAKSIVLLLGVQDSAAILMETFYHLCNHGRLENVEIHAIFAAGGKGSGGKKIELASATKAARKRLISQDRVKFTTNLGDIIKLLTNVTVFDALGHDGELTQNAVKGLTEWMKKLLLASPPSASKEEEKKIIYGIESSLLKSTAGSLANLQLVTFGMARETLTPALPISNSILYVDAGMPVTEETKEIFGASFVTEIEY